MSKWRKWFGRKKDKQHDPPGRVFALPIPAGIHSSVLDLTSRTDISMDELPGASHEGPVVHPRRASHPPTKSMSVLSAFDGYEHLIQEAVDESTSQDYDYDSTVDQTYLKTVVSEEDSGQIDLRLDDRFPTSTRDQLPNRPNNPGGSTGGAAGCSLDIQFPRYGQVVKERQSYPEREHTDSQPLSNPRINPRSVYIPQSSPVRRRNLPAPPIPRGSSIRNQEGFFKQPLKSDDPQSSDYPMAYREFVEGRLPVQPIINVNAEKVTFGNIILVGTECLPFVTDFLRNDPIQESSPPIRKPAPGPQYDPQNYVEGAPRAREEATYRGLAFVRNRQESS